MYTSGRFLTQRFGLDAEASPIAAAKVLAAG
jgi:hypothetical protein